MLERSGTDSHGRQNFSEMDAGTLAALGLKKETVFVPMEEAKPRTANAERVARHRQKKAKVIAEAGLESALVPIEVAAKIRAMGFATWLEKIKAEAITSAKEDAPRRPATEEMLFTKVCGLKGWRLGLVKLLVG